MTDNPLSLPNLLTGKPDPYIYEFMAAAREQGLAITFGLEPEDDLDAPCKTCGQPRSKSHLCPSDYAGETPDAQ